MSLVPYVIEQTNRGERSYDIFSRLLNDRIVMLTDEVNNTTASLVVAQLLYLEGQDPTKDIHLYINSPGGSVTAGMSIFDTMHTLNVMFLPFAWVWLPAWVHSYWQPGAKGKRYTLPNSTIMIHQPSGGAQGQATDIMIHADYIVKTKQRLNQILAEKTGQPLEVIARDTERDNFMDAEAALAYGLVDKIISK